MNGVGEVLEDAPDPISEVEVEQVEIMNFGDGMYMMVFQSHGEERGFEDATEYAGFRDGVKRNYFRRRSERRNGDMGLHRHGGIFECEGE